MTDVKENPYEGPDAEGNIERDLASFKAVSGMSTATEYLINMITALKNARAQVADLWKELARMSLTHDAVAQHRDICNDAVKERDVRVATLEADLAAAKETAQHWQRIAEQRRERADADLARVTIDRDTESARYRRASNDLAGVQQSLADARAELRIANLHYENADGNFLRMAKAYDDRGDEIDDLRTKLTAAEKSNAEALCQEVIRGDDLSNEVDDLRAKLAALEADLATEESDNRRHLRWVDERDARIAALEAELAAAKMRYDELHDQRHAEARKADALAADLAATKMDE